MSRTLDYAVAEAVFGWRWMAYLGMPTNDHPLYDDPICRGGPGIRVRRFMSPEALKSEQWKTYWAKHEGAPATGEEPLAYCYCSSMGPAFVPNFSGDANAIEDMEKALRKRGLLKDYRRILGRKSSKQAKCLAAVQVVQAAALAAAQGGEA